MHSSLLTFVHPCMVLNILCVTRASLYVFTNCRVNCCVSFVADVTRSVFPFTGRCTIFIHGSFALMSPLLSSILFATILTTVSGMSECGVFKSNPHTPSIILSISSSFFSGGTEGYRCRKADKHTPSFRRNFYTFYIVTHHRFFQKAR